MHAPTTRRERERTVRRQDFLNAARAVFAEKGFAPATMDEIAQRAEYGKGTIYNYFQGGKEDLLFALFDDLYEDILERTRRTLSPEAVETHGFAPALRRFLEDSFRFFLDQREAFLLIIKVAYEMTFSNEHEKARYFQRQSNRIAEALLPALERGAALGQIRPLPPLLAAHAILGGISAVQMHLLQGCEGLRRCDAAPPTRCDTPEEAAAAVAQLFLNGLCTPLTPDPSLTSA